MPLHVHKGKGAEYVADPSHIHSEKCRKKSIISRLGAETRDQKQGGEDGDRSSSTRETWRKQPRGREGLAGGNRTRPVGYLQPLGGPPLDPGGQPKAPTRCFRPDPHRSVLQQPRHLPVRAGPAGRAGLLREIVHVSQGRLQQELRRTALLLIRR